MAAIGKQTVDGRIVWYDSGVFPRFEPRLFNPDWLRANGHLTGTSTGRNEAYFLTFGDLQLVLRHYYRGGLIGRLVKDRFLRQPVAQSRAMREFTLLDWMREQGLPVPRPIAAQFTPVGPWYRADLLMERLPGTRTLADLLQNTALAPDIWGRVGDAIGQLHRAGVFHSDLNCRNILLDQLHRVWLIDFDKCARRAPGKWSAENLARLHRSLTKEKTQHPALHWCDEDWTALLRGHQARMSLAPTEGADTQP